MGESRRMQAVQEPIISVVGELIRRHPGTISLGQGVVHYGPPPEARAAVEAFFADPDNHKYRLVQGIPPLLGAIEAKLDRENGIDTDGSRIVVTAGGNMAFLNAVLATSDPDDEVILLAPFYFNHEMAVRMASCAPRVVDTDADYQPDLTAIRAAVGPRTRAVVTISPNNPTGAVYPEATLRAINRLCRERGLYHIHDEAYEYFTYEGARHFSPGSIAGAAGHTISLFSLSKSFGMASWRIGYMVLPEHLYMAVRKIQDTNLICPPVVSQHAAVGAMRVGAAYPRRFLPELAETRRIVLEALAALGDRVTVPPALGAFYFLLRVDTELEDMAIIERLIVDHGVAVIPGRTFGMTDGCCLRVAYGALAKSAAAEGIGRLAQGAGGDPRVKGQAMQVIGVQLDIAWEDKAANFERVRRLVREAAPAPGALVVLPEMFATGFSMAVERIAEAPDGPTAAMLGGLARGLGAWVLGGLVTRGPEGKGRNEAYLFAPDGSRAARYAKMHPFRYAGETDHYAPGDAVVTAPVGEMVLAPTVCYDLRFPELYRHAALRGATMLAVIANWPASREAHWLALATARAIENQAYVVAVNRTGRDPNHAYSGRSLIVDPQGRVLVDAGADEGIVEAEVDAQAVRSWRATFPALEDAKEELLGL